MSNERLRKDGNEDCTRNAANDNPRPHQLRDVDQSAGAAATNPATIPNKPYAGDPSSEMPLGSGVQHQSRFETPSGGNATPSVGSQVGGPGTGGAPTPSVGPRGKGTDGFGGAGTGPEHRRGAHANGEPADTKDDRHPGSGWQDEKSVTPPATQQQPPRQQPGRPKDQNADQRPLSTGAGETTNRPGSNPNVTPRTGEKTKTYEGPTGVSGEAGSNADDA